MATPKYNTYVGMRYVPIFDGEWDRTKTYEPLTIVSYQGNSYTSRTFIPVGMDINNTEYWALTGNYNAQVEYYRQETQRVRDLIYDTIATPEMYGAIGDGVADDTDAVQAALASGNIVVLKNTYAIDIETHILPPSNSTMCFDGGKLVALPASQVSTNQYAEPVIFINGVHDVKICGNGIIDGNRDNQPEVSGSTNEWASGIRIADSSNVEIQDIKLINCHGDGIEIYKNCSDIVISNICCDNNYRQGLTIGGVENCTVTNSIFSNTHGTAPSAGIDVEAESSYKAINVSIDNCAFYNNTYGILVGSKNYSGDDDYTITNVTISNCTIYNDEGYTTGDSAGLRIECKDNCTVSNCTIKQFPIGIWVRASDAIIIADCIVTDCDNDAVQIQTCTHTVIDNCTLRNNGRGLYITQGSTQTRIRNNRIYNNRGVGLRIYGGTEAFKIIDTFIDFNTLMDNRNGLSYEANSGEIMVNGYYENVVIDGNVIEKALTNTGYAIYIETLGISSVFKNRLVSFADGVINNARTTFDNIIDSKPHGGTLTSATVTTSKPSDIVAALIYADDPIGTVKPFTCYWSDTSTSHGLTSQANLAGWVAKVVNNQYILFCVDAEGRKYYSNGRTADNWISV